ncbi:MAG TPA: HAMP domain-containing sensor histidine kinase [Acidimicrobiales bacterium]|nr:HAMP domain-containing sensor histidine kinase [Acidimicrobiales bacterium]
MSLRRRLLLGLLTIGAVLVVTNVTLSNRFERFLLERIDSQLIDVSSSALFREDRPQRPGSRGPRPEDTTLSEYYLAVGNPALGRMVRVGSALGGERPGPVLEASTVLDHVERPGRAVPFSVGAESGGGSWRLVALATGPPEQLVAVVGLSLDEVESTVARIRLVQILGTLAVLSTLGLVSWWVLRLGVDPIEEMAVTADAIAAGDLSRRVEHPGEGTEVGRLGVAFNAMLERIQGAFREREASEDRVRRFAADASHELRTPLTSILGYAELYRAGGLRGEGELAEAMARTEQEGRRMAALVEDLLLLARLDQHRPPERTPVRLDRIVDEAVRDARVVEPDRPISYAGSAVVVDGDERQLRQVAGNLLTNARVHTPPGTPVHVRVELRNGDGGDRAVLEVVDEGPGMAPDVAARVFDRFYRADASRVRAAGDAVEARTGTGLGLAIVQGVAAGHGGRATVTSAPGTGSRFTVELPAADAGTDEV